MENQKQNIKHPSFEQIRKWVYHELSPDEQVEVGKGILFFQDHQTQAPLQFWLAQKHKEDLEIEEAEEESRDFTLFSDRVKNLIEKLKSIGQDVLYPPVLAPAQLGLETEKIPISMRLVPEDHQDVPSLLSAEQSQTDKINSADVYQVRLQANRSFRFDIAIENGTHLVTLLYANDDASGILYPGTTKEEIDLGIKDGPVKFKTHGYELTEDRVCFTLISTPAHNVNWKIHNEEYYRIMSAGDGLEAIKWVKYVQQNTEDFLVAMLVIEK